MDNLSKPDHPLWKILRLIVVGAILVVCCSVFYNNGFDRKDIVMIAMTLLGLGGYDQAKSVLTREQPIQ
jgi:hypothetical protein